MRRVTFSLQSSRRRKNYKIRSTVAQSEETNGFLLLRNVASQMVTTRLHKRTI